MTTELSTPRLETRHLAVHFGDRPALEDVSLSFHAHEIVSLVGPNGAGKSTLLRSLAGILAPSHGQVLFNGTPIEGPDPCVIYIPQRTSVDWTFPISVIDVVLMARLNQRPRIFSYSRADKGAAMSTLEQVGMEHLARVQISQLSGGQQQRVFLARALLAQGDVYLLDEPFTGVDAPTQELVSALLESLCRSGKTVIAATHDLEHAAEASTRVVLLNRRVLADGPPATSLTSESLVSAYGGHFTLLSRLQRNTATQ